MEKDLGMYGDRESPVPSEGKKEAQDRIIFGLENELKKMAACH
jgi:hypothetical protein